MCLFQFWFPWCVCPAVGLLGRMAVLFPVFKGISTLFSIVAILLCISTNSVRGLALFSAPSPAFILCRLFDSSHSDQCEMVPHCGFNLHFSENKWCWASFHVMSCFVVQSSALGLKKKKTFIIFSSLKTLDNIFSRVPDPFFPLGVCGLINLPKNWLSHSLNKNFQVWCRPKCHGEVKIL